jgi:hypothetical protein
MSTLPPVAVIRTKASLSALIEAIKDLTTNSIPDAFYRNLDGWSRQDAQDLIDAGEMVMRELLTRAEHRQP